MTLILSVNIIAQERKISGVVIDEFDVRVCGVVVQVEGTSKQVVTDNKGKFKIKAKPADILVFSKEHYLVKTVGVSNLPGMRVVIPYNFKQAVEELYKNTSGKGFPICCNPLYVINGGVEWNYREDGTISENKIRKKDIKSVLNLKGLNSADKFGRFANNGVVWITIKCIP